MNLRAAIWSAVSSKAQAKEDKVSIEVQIQRAREIIQARAWHEASGPYIAIASRTRWVDLKDAAAAIPDLALLITDARARTFDVLIIFDYTRLRALLQPLSKVLSAYGIQIFNASQPNEIIDPALYDPANADGANIGEFTADFMSRAEIAALKRRRKLGMPGRATKKGLPAGTIPYGYRKPIGRETDRNVIPEQDPIKAATVMLMKDLFLSGQSLWQIANELTAQGAIKPRGGTKWSDVNVRLILKHRFYGGEVSFGNTRFIADPITGEGKIIKNPPSLIHIGKGAHIPLWDEATQDAIETEFARRGQRYRGQVSHRLSHILYCGICDGRMWVEYPGGYAREGSKGWSCRYDRSHICIKDHQLFPLVMQELKNKLENISAVELPTPPDETASLTTSLKELKKRKSRILDAYESSAINLVDFTDRTEDLNAQIAHTEKQIKSQHNIAHQIKQQSESLNTFAEIIKTSPDYLTNAPAQRVNTHLRNIISKVTVTPTQVSITFRTA